MKNFDYVQYGCGLTAPSHWRNFDASPTLQIEKLPLLGYLYSQGKPIFPNNVEYGDIVKGLPIPSNSCKAVYCSHVLEHLAFDDFNVALQNTFKILQPGAAFRFVLPDLEYYARQYLNSDQSDAALTFMKDTGLGIEYRPKGVKGFIRSLFGNSVHRWMWDYKSMLLYLENVGFGEIRKANFGDSSDPMFRDVEDEGRWINCLGFECRKPL